MSTELIFCFTDISHDKIQGEDHIPIPEGQRGGGRLWLQFLIYKDEIMGLRTDNKDYFELL